MSTHAKPLSTAERQQLCQAVLTFIEQRIYPLESSLADPRHPQRATLLQELKQQARREQLWALGHPAEIGGGGLSFLDFVYVNEIIGRSEFAQLALGTYSHQDSLMLAEHGNQTLRERYLRPLVDGELYPSFAMTEPDIASSDPTQLRTSAELDNGQWLINGRKWFTTGADIAAYTTVMCRTEGPDCPPHRAFSQIIVPTDNPGYCIERSTPVLGLDDGHFEVEYREVRVPENHLLGKRGEGFKIAQQRLGPGRIFHCMRWLGQAQRAFDLMCRRLHARSAFGSSLADKQLLQAMVFESHAEIQAARQYTLFAAHQIDAGQQARIDIGSIKVIGARMLHNVIDRAIQVHGAMGLTEDTVLDRMYRHARAARIYDGPDEVHIQSVARQLLKSYADDGPGFRFNHSAADSD